MEKPEQTSSSNSDQHTFIAELSQFALASPSLAALFDLTVHRVKEILKADFCEVLEYDPQSEKLLLRAGAGWKKRLVGRAQFDAGVEWQAGYTLFSENLVVVDDLSMEQRFHAPPLLIEKGVTSGISALINGIGHSYGVLSVHSRNRGNFDQGDAKFVQSIANILASYIQHSSSETELHNLATSIEKRLQAQEELLENVLAQSQIILWSIDWEGELHLSRRGGLAALGIPSGDQLGINVFEILPQDHLLAEYLNQALDGTVVYVDFKVDNKIYDLRILPQVDQLGDVIGVNGIAIDITRRIETEQALRKSEQIYRLVVENVQEYAIISLDRDGYITSWNVGAQRIKGYQASEIIGKHYSIFFTPEDRNIGLPQTALQIALRQGKFEAEGWRVRKDGTKYWANILLNPLKNDQGELLGFTKLIRDFTSRREAEQALQESETRFRSIFEFGAMGIALLDLSGNFLLTNPSLQKMLRFQEQELLSHSLKSLSYPFDAPALLEMYTEIVAGRINLFRQESRFQRKDGQIVWVSLTFSLVGDANASSAFVVGLFEDITYRERMEAELCEIKRQLILSEEKQRLFLAQELHDDPMQELYGVLFQLETLDLGTPQDPVSQNELQSQLKLTKDMIEKVIQRLREMCGQLRPINLAPFGLEGAIREHIDKFQEEHPNLKIKLELTYDGQILLEEVRISLFRIYQQAMGNIIRHAQANNVVVRFYYDQQKATLEVEDDGVGFDVPFSLLRLAHQDHLGIAGAAERAELLGGKLTIRSAPGKGTLIRADVPLKTFEDPAFHEVG